MTDSEVLAEIALSPDRLVRIARAATTIWTRAVERARAASGGRSVPYCYGTVDFLIRQDDGAAVPIEMNGANVGCHPTVHPMWLDAFGRACTGALRDLGLQEPSACRPMAHMA
jgi:hypothetical protein